MLQGVPNIDKIKLLDCLIKPWSTISDDGTVIGDIRQIAIGRFDLCGCLLRAIQKRCVSSLLSFIINKATERVLFVFGTSNAYSVKLLDDGQG